MVTASIASLGITANAETSTEDSTRMEVFSIGEGFKGGAVGGRTSRKLTEGRYDFGYWVRGISGGWQPAGTFSNAELVATASGNKAYCDWK